MKQQKSVKLEQCSREELTHVFTVPLSSREGCVQVARLLTGKNVAAVRACFDAVQRMYRIEALGEKEYQHLRRTSLLAACFSPVEKFTPLEKFVAEVARFAQTQETMVFLDLGESIRIYHF